VTTGAGLRRDCTDLLDGFGCFAGVGTDGAGIAQLGTALLQQKTDIGRVLLYKRRGDLEAHDETLSGE
jgi:hypothetical protein